MANNTSIVNLVESVKIDDSSLLENLPEPYNLLFYLIPSLSGLTFFLFLVFHDGFNNWIFSKMIPRKLSKTPYSELKLELDDLKSIISKLTSNYRILITVYGILLAFVISDKISFAFFNWNFIIWTGWILGVIVKSALNLTDLSDMAEKKRSLETIQFDVYKYNQFFKHSIIILIFGVAFLPSFIFMEDPSIEKLEGLPWPRSISIMSGAFGILSAAAGFFWILGLTPTNVKYNTLLMYFSVILLFVFGSISTWSNLSPIEPRLTIFGDLQFEIPQIVVTVLSFTAGLAILPVFFLMEMYDQYRAKKKLNAKNSSKDKN